MATSVPNERIPQLESSREPLDSTRHPAYMFAETLQQVRTRSKEDNILNIEKLRSENAKAASEAKLSSQLLLQKYNKILT